MASTPNIISRLDTAIRNLSAGKKIILVIVIAATIAGCIFLLTWTTRPEFRHLYSNLTLEDAGPIVTKLKEQNIPYRISSNGSSILIPKELVYEVRMEFASQGLPQGSGVGFEIFDNTKLGMTEFVQNVNYQRALQGELSRTINRFNEVESSRVHIVIPKRSLFIEGQESATASVSLKLHSGKWLSKDQVQGIVHLVSSSVPGLSPDKVTVLDNFGKLLAGFEDNSTLPKVNSEHLEYQKRLETNLENRVKTMLEKALGQDKAIVRITCLLDFKIQEKTEERYYPDNQIARSEQTSNSMSFEEEKIPAGIPGILSNISRGKPASTVSKTKPAFQKQDRTVNYEIGKLTSHTIVPTGTIKRVSTAVIIDGTYKPVKPDKGKKDKKSDLEYISRTAEEMTKYENIVKRAVSFDSARGDEIEIINIPFATANMENKNLSATEKSWISKVKEYKGFMKYGVSAIIMLLVFIYVVRPLIKWLTSTSIAEMQIFNQLPKTVAEIEREYALGSKGLPFRNKAIDMITEDTDKTSQIMQSWLKER